MPGNPRLSNSSVSELVSCLANADVSRKEKHLIVGKLKQLSPEDVKSHCQQLLNSECGVEILVNSFEYIFDANFDLPDSFYQKLLDRTISDICDSPAGSARLLRSCQTALKLLRSRSLEAAGLAEVVNKLRPVLMARAIELQHTGGIDCLCLVYLLLVSVSQCDLAGLTLESLTGQSSSLSDANSRLAFWHALLTQDAYLCRHSLATVEGEDRCFSSLETQRYVDCLFYALQLNSTDADSLLMSRTILACFEALVARCQSADIGSASNQLTPPQLTQLTLDYVMANMESHIFLVKHNCSAIFNCLVRLIDRLGGGWDAVLRRVHSLTWEAKAKYVLLQGLSAVEPLLVLSSCPNVLRIAVQQSREHVLGYYASDLFVALAPHCESVRSWLDALVKGVDSASDGHLLSVRDHFLQKLIRLSRPAFLTALCQADYKKQSHRASRVKLLILSAGLKRVQLSPEQSDVIASLLRPACFWLHSRISFDAFNIWLSLQQSTASAELLSNQFEFCAEFFTAWLTGCQRSEERQRLVAAFRAFLKRSHAWMKSAFDSAETGAAFYTDRMLQLCRSFLGQLHPGCSFPRRSSILELCSVLLEHTVRCAGGLVDFNPRQLLGNFSGSVAAQISDTFDANRANAVQLLSLIMRPCQTDLAAALASSAASLQRSWRPQDASTAHHLFAALTHPGVPSHCRLALADAIGCRVEHQLMLVEWLTDQLEEQVVDAETCGLRYAAIRSPMHPTLHCLRGRLARPTAPADPDCGEGDRVDELPTALAERLLLLAKRAASVVSPLVTSSAPEGGVVGDQLDGGYALGPGLSLESACFDAANEDLQVGAAAAVNLPEFLVVCCWRTVKEASLLVAGLSERFIPGDGCAETWQFRERLVLEIHAFYKELLFDSRHRGAFELAYEGFGRFCASVWRCPAPLGCLPGRWLDKLLSNLAGPPVDELRLCLTRRSAGLPYYILGIVSSEPAPVKSVPPAALRRALDSLLSLADTRTGEDEFLVHVYNTLPALFADSRVGPATTQWVAPALCRALDGFNAKNWSIRNSCTRLFSALFVRIFGVTRCREETSKKNVLSTSVFFHRYPGVYEYLKRKLEHGVQLIRTGALTPELFPVLLLFSRLTPPVKEASPVHDGGLDTGVFVPLIIDCGASPMIRLRRLSARALTAVVPASQLAGLAERLLICALAPPSAPFFTGATNRLHGALLQLAAAADELAPALPGREERQAVFGRLAGLCLDRLHWLALPSDCCPTLAGAYARALRALLRPLGPEAVLRLLQASDARLARLIGRRLYDDPATMTMSTTGCGSLLDEPGGPDMFAACMELACELLRALGQRSAVGHVPDLAATAAAGLLLTWLEMPVTRCAEVQRAALDWLLHESPRCPLQSSLLSSPGLVACCLRLVGGSGRPADASVVGLAAEFLNRSFFSSARHSRRLSNYLDKSAELSLLSRLEQLAVSSGDSPAAGPCLRLWVRLLAAGGAVGGRTLLRLVAFDQPDRLRLAAAQALRVCGDALADLSHDLENRLDLWEAATTALMDDFDEVAAEICACVSALAGWDEPACQSQCLDWLIDRLLPAGESASSNAIAERLLAWLLDGFYAEQVEAGIAQAKPIRLFDRSELNICWDSLLLCRRIVDRLTAAQPVSVTADCLERLSNRLAGAAAAGTPVSAWPDPARESSTFAEASQSAARLRLARRFLAALGADCGLGDQHEDEDVAELLKTPYAAYIRCGGTSLTS